MVGLGARLGGRPPGDDAEPAGGNSPWPAPPPRPGSRPPTPPARGGGASEPQCAGDGCGRDTAEVWRWLSEVPDPEIPVISLTDLGIIRDVRWDGDMLVVTVTPTYSGCPATTIINLDIERALRERGVERLRLERQLSPPWTTDWISAEGREKLRAYGIAPPIDGTAADGRLLARVGRMAGESNLGVACPRCGSTHTERVSQFGSTPCKASWRCTECLEPFDYFKCI